MYTINHTQPSCKATGPRVMYEPLEPGQLGSSIPRHGAAVPRDLFHKPFSLTRQGTLRCSLAGHTSGYYLFYNSIIFRAKKHEKSFIWGSAIYNMMRVESCCILLRYSAGSSRTMKLIIFTCLASTFTGALSAEVGDAGVGRGVFFSYKQDLIGLA